MSDLPAQVQRFLRALLAAAAVLLLSAAPALAHGDDVVAKPGQTEAQAEAEHEHEHEIIGFWERKIAAMTASQKRAFRDRALTQTAKRSAKRASSGSAKAKRLQDQPVGPADVYGAWPPARSRRRPTASTWC